MAILGATLPAVFAIMLSSQTMATQITQDIQKQPALEKIRGEPGDDKNLEENLRILRIIIEERLNFFSLQMLKLDTLNRLILHSHIPGGEFLQGRPYWHPLGGVNKNLLTPPSFSNCEMCHSADKP